jgi:acylphosphatase
MDKTRVRIIIRGRVQGVFFRDSTRRKAKELGVLGWVKNRDDGDVEVLAEGASAAVEKLAEWCHKGPPHAMVIKVRQEQEEWQGEFDSFNIVF